MSTKPTNLASLARYLAEHPMLELHMPGSTSVARGNCGDVPLGDPQSQIVPRKFLRKQGDCFVFSKCVPNALDGKGGETRLTIQPAKDYAFFEDRFEVMGLMNDNVPLRYFYK